MVGSALSFDLDASRLIYTSNTWHFSRQAKRRQLSSSFPDEIFSTMEIIETDKKLSTNNGK